MKKLILLLLFIPLVSFGQKKSLLTKSGVSLTFDKPEGMKESSFGPAAINPNVLVQYGSFVSGGYTIVAKIYPSNNEFIKKMTKEKQYAMLEKYHTEKETDSEGNSLKLINFDTTKVKGKLFGFSVVDVERNLTYRTNTFYYYINNTLIEISGTASKSIFEFFIKDFIDFVWSIDIRSVNSPCYIEKNGMKYIEDEDGTLTLAPFNVTEKCE